MQTMSASTNLALGHVASADNLQRAQFYQSQHHTHNNNNNTKHTSASYYHFPHHTVSLDSADDRAKDPYNALATNVDPLLADTTTHSTLATTLSLHKSSSCNAMFKPKSTILIQDSANGRINTSLTDSDSDFGATLVSGDGNAAEGCSEQDAFLSCVTGTESGAAANGSSSSSASSRRSTRSHGKSKSSICYRAHAFITRNWYLSYLVPLSILLALMFVAYLTRDYAKRLLYWIETQNPWVIFAMFMFLFVVVSFPVVVGYFVLMITSGYLFGFFKGFLTVILGANVGIAIAHVTIRSLRHRIPMHKLIKNETGRAILRVISGPRAFKVVLFTRLTPIPFGIQNAIFGVSSINPRIYHTATFLGLLPAQTINVYLGSTLRSMHEVLNNHGTALTGYISFGIEVICGVALMFWVVQKARKELSDTLLSDISNDGKLIDIQV